MRYTREDGTRRAIRTPTLHMGIRDTIILRETIYSSITTGNPTISIP